MSLFSCDFGDGTCHDYRERIELSDGTVKCCETQVVIPAGMPYAHCQLAWSEDSLDDEDLDESGDPTAEYIESIRESYPQALEIWRFLRANNQKHGACPAFEDAFQAYTDAYNHPVGKFLYLGFVGRCKTISKRYAEGKGPRLHKSELNNLVTGKWERNMPFETAYQRRLDSARIRETVS